MRIAILGGGVGSMAAAYWLTNKLPDGTTPDHDITVYQMGWRLGGKGASGRNAEAGQRIEEHGLHIWLGFYANAFRMMRAVYGELNRPPGAPLATWQDAFKPQTVVSMMDTDADGRWLENEWTLATPILPGLPGDQTGFGEPCSYHCNLLVWVKERIEAFLERHGHSGDAHSRHFLHLKAILEHLHEAAAHAGPAHESGWKNGPHGHHHHLLLLVKLEVLQTLIGLGLRIADDWVELRRVLMLADVAVATGIGMIKDLCGRPWDAIDDEEWRAWLTRHGMHEQTAWSSIIRALYDIAFAFRDGEATPAKADLAAGTATCAMLRIYFDYYQSIFLRMQAGMGDAIFAPIYEVLKRRGVKFKFFHRLRELVPSEDGTRIEALRVGVQATVKAGEYQPLVDVKGLPSWPAKPLYDQLNEGESLRAAQTDLEAYASPDAGELVLRRGADFDHVVFGLSIGAVPKVCPAILRQKEPWRKMVEKVKTVRTQAAQLWFSRNVADLGWTSALNGRCYGERAIFGTYVEPIDTWADMSQLLPLEEWSVPVNNIAYFCGAMRDDDPATTDVPRELMRKLLEEHMHLAWVYACKKGSFRYDWLAVEEGAGDRAQGAAELTGEERFRRQYFRVNVEPTELYVLSVSGSTKYRLDPADNGYANLSLAGDWVSNGFPIGCVESAVLGGMKGVQRLCPGMQIVE